MCVTAPAGLDLDRPRSLAVHREGDGERGNLLVELHRRQVDKAVREERPFQVDRLAARADQRDLGAPGAVQRHLAGKSRVSIRRPGLIGRGSKAATASNRRRKRRLGCSFVTWPCSASMLGR
jgi:hypothetical protein